MIIPSPSSHTTISSVANEFETEELIAIAPGVSGELKKAIILGIHTKGGGIV
jgi:hypothetical protein